MGGRGGGDRARRGADGQVRGPAGRGGPREGAAPLAGRWGEPGAGRGLREPVAAGGRRAGQGLRRGLVAGGRRSGGSGFLPGGCGASGPGEELGRRLRGAGPRRSAGLERTVTARGYAGLGWAGLGCAVLSGAERRQPRARLPPLPGPAGGTGRVPPCGGTQGGGWFWGGRGALLVSPAIAFVPPYLVSVPSLNVRLHCLGAIGKVMVPAAFLPGASRAVISAPPLGMPRSSHGTYYSASVS